MPVAIITGGGSGIGAALALRLCLRYSTIIVGRRADALASTKAAAPAGGVILDVVADLTTDAGVAALRDATRAACSSSSSHVQLLIHNAAIIGPIAPALQTGITDFRSTFAANVDAPLAVTQAIYPLMTRGSRILHISSGAANAPFVGWTSYCCSKAALSMLWRMLREELRPAGIVVGSARPGVVDTGMQTYIRTAATDEACPSRARFVQLHVRRAELDASSGEERGEGVGAPPPKDALDTPANVAVFLDWLLHDTAEEEFAASEWDIRDAAHQTRWAVSV